MVLGTSTWLDARVHEQEHDGAGTIICQVLHDAWAKGLEGTHEETHDNPVKA